MTSIGDFTMGILVLLGNKENSVGKKNYSCLEKVQEFRSSATLLGNYPRLGIRQKFNCDLVDSQTLRQLAGESGETGWFLLWIGSRNFDLTGEEGFISAEGL